MLCPEIDMAFRTVNLCEAAHADRPPKERLEGEIEWEGDEPFHVALSLCRGAAAGSSRHHLAAVVPLMSVDISKVVTPKTKRYSRL